ncbi:MAG TPA: RCC1 domain-containing protein [Polyangia bacterium]
MSMRRAALWSLIPLGLACCGGDGVRANRDGAWDAPVDAGAVDAVGLDGAVDRVGDASFDVRPSSRYGVTAIAIGEYHLCAILDDGRVKCWGGNGVGEHGQGNRNQYKKPVFVDLGTGRRARSIAAARYATCAILDDGRVKCWGDARQLGLGTDVSHGMGPGQMGDRLPYLELGEGRTAKTLAMGSSKACAVLDDESLVCWSGQPPQQVAGPATASERIVKLAPVSQQVFGLRANGTLFLPSPSLVGELPEGPISVIGGNQRSSTIYVVVGDELRNLSFAGAPLKLWSTPVALSVGPSVCFLVEQAVRCLGFSGAWWLAPTQPAHGAGWEVNLGQPAVELVTAGIDLHCAILADQSAKCWGEGAPNLRFVVPAEARVPGMQWPSIDFGTRE